MGPWTARSAQASLSSARRAPTAENDEMWRKSLSMFAALTTRITRSSRTTKTRRSSTVVRPHGTSRCTGGRPPRASSNRCDHLADELLRAWTLDDELAHVAHVENADPLPHGPVLLDDAPVAHRHEEAGELDHLRRERFVMGVSGVCLISPIRSPRVAMVPGLRARPLPGLRRCARLPGNGRAREPSFRSDSISLSGRPSPGPAQPIRGASRPCASASQSMTAAGVPAATTHPPSSPPSGPRSMMWSAANITSGLCSITTTVFPLSTSLFNTSRSICTSSW